MTIEYKPVDGETLSELVGQYAAMHNAWTGLANSMADMLLVITERMLSEGHQRIDTGKVTATLHPARTSSGYLAEVTRNRERHDDNR